MKKIKEIEIDGCVIIPDNITEEKFVERFLEFLEMNGWSFGGGITELDEKGEPKH